MIENGQITAVIVDETGEAKCGYCGKTLLIYIRKRLKSTKIKDEISIKCPRCKKKNGFEV